ncbi:hypothetical protein K7W42_21990 [Deinococcus sp. HMF7604]|uniref:COG1470 family protein n=1 Tax=Deinococcus betulae TaxID=2873312 RepID=UPI001CCCBB5C|nr:hypothetical protein [Deinococcus betulae]MBZ9753507.1 hypothetical protein [Deinococcus betulae]
MKKLSSAMLGLTVLLTACPDPTPPISEYTLSLALTGVISAPVKVTNLSTNTILNEGTLTSGKTFSGISAGTILKIEPGTVNGYMAPSAQTITLDANKTVTLEYKAVVIPGNQVKNNQVEGTVTGIPYAGAVVLANPNDFDTKNIGTLSSAGAVSLPLSAAPAELRTFLPPADLGCTFTGSASGNPNTALFSGLDVLSNQSDLLGYIYEAVTNGAPADSVIGRLYSASAATIKGTVNCGPSGGTFAIDATLQAGWNAVVLTTTASGYNLSNSTANIRTELRGGLYEASVQAVLPKEPLSFTNNDTVTVPVTFYQDGGYNGYIKLSTDVPELTIAPTTLNLPALSAQNTGMSLSSYLRTLGLAPQRVTTNLTFRYTGGERTGPFNLNIQDANNKIVGRGQGTMNARPSSVGVVVPPSQPSLSIRQGEAGNVRVSLTSINGFGGSVTVTMVDLPTGVTATPSTVTLTPGNALEVNIPVQVSANADTATSTIRVSVNTRSSSIGPTTIPLTIQPKAPQTYSLQISLAGVPSAQINVKNKDTGENIYIGTLSIQTTLGELPGGTTVLIESQDIDFMSTPQPIEILIQKDEVVTVQYAPDPRLSATLLVTGEAELQNTQSLPAKDIDLRTPIGADSYKVGVLAKDLNFSASLAPDLYQFATKYFSFEKERLLSLRCNVDNYNISRDTPVYVSGHLSTPSYLDSVQFYRYFINIAFIGPETRIDPSRTYRDSHTLVFTKVPIALTGSYTCGNTKTDLGAYLKPGWNLLTTRTTILYDAGVVSSAKEEILAQPIDSYNGPYLFRVLSQS